MKTCVVYYSRSGNCRYLAGELANKVQSDTLVELVEKENRKGFFGFMKSGFQGVTGKASRLEGDPWGETGACDRIYLVGPIWAGNTCPAVNAFLAKADLADKEVVAITLQADQKMEKAGVVFDGVRRRVEQAGGKLAASHALHSAHPGRFAGNEKLLTELEKVTVH
jgi:hypothetical protein